jgi:AhpD family alkylhydroperoxidase
MATFRHVKIEEAEGVVKDVYDDIKTTYGRNASQFYQCMGHSPEYLKASWERSKLCYLDEGKLGMKLKHIVTLAVSATNNCDYCVKYHTIRLKELGMSDEELVELMMVVDVVNGYNRFAQGAMPDHPGVAFGPEGLIYRNQTDAKSKPPSRGSA